jgi:hypothetical protein
MQKAALLAMNGDVEAGVALLGDPPPEDDLRLFRFYGFCALGVYELAGDPVKGGEIGLAAAATGAADGEVAHTSTLYGWSASLLGDAGETERARRAMVAGRDTSPRDDPASQSVWRIAAAQVAAADGDDDAARRHLEEAVEWFDRTDQLNERALVRRLAARVLLRLGETARARELLLAARDMFDAKGNIPMTQRCVEELATLP